MGSRAHSSIPTIDLTKDNIKPETQSWFSIGQKVRNALEEYGCFVANYDQIPPEIRNSVFQAVKELFDLPLETKNKFGSVPINGYSAKRPFVLHESMTIGKGSDIRSFANTIWESGNDQFCDIVSSYSKGLAELEQIVMRMVFQAYGVEKHYKAHAESMIYLLRVLKYRVPSTDELNVSSHIHTDKGFITILDQNHINALQVKTRDDEWIEVDFSHPSSFVVMAGDAFFAWSNGRIMSPLHQVLMNGKETRYSITQFSIHNGIVQIPEELVDEEHPLQFKPFNHFGLLRYYFEDESRLSLPTAKAYCGI